MSLIRRTQGPLPPGVELPLDNDGSQSGESTHRNVICPLDVHDMAAPAECIAQVDRLGFRTTRLRDIPLCASSFTTQHRFGISADREVLIRKLKTMQTTEINHIGLHFRSNKRPLGELLDKIGRDELPRFQNHTPTIALC